MKIIKNLVLILIILSFPSLALAKVTGVCSNCHTMHNMQNGTVITEGGPFQYLTITSCVGCHSADTGVIKTVGDSVVPVVYTQNEPSTYLAGGNFHWVATDDTKGHNIPGISRSDSNLSTAPGLSNGTDGDGNSFFNCGCHDSGMTLGFSSEPGGVAGYCTGCDCCHDPGHHIDDSGPVVGNETGWPKPYYRFLSPGYDSRPHPSSYLIGSGFYGVAGIEDDDWENTVSSTDHNEYAGGDTEHSISVFCGMCHGQFYEKEKPFTHHPTDYAIPNKGEYADAFGANGTGTGTWDPMVPIARPDITSFSEPSSEVRIGTDVVQCLSCHRPYGSQYSDMLRWDYENACTTNATPDECGCIVCHTNHGNISMP